MIKSLGELLSSHLDLYQNGGLVGSTRSQVDYLRFYVPSDKWLLYGTPWDGSQVRDNPNYEPTQYQSIYKLTDYKTSLWDYVIPGYAPVSVLRWSKVKVKKGGKVQELIEVCIYGKALALYYAGHLSRLDDFVIKYGGECTRVDICWDFKEDIPGDEFPLDIYTDLKRSGQFPNDDLTGYDTVYYGKKHSPFMIRVYNKTADLRKDKNIHSYIYPKWYLKKCRRVEVELKGRYSNIATPIDWLKSQKRDFKISPLEQTKRNNYKTALYNK